jgi:hypothetical protein
MTTRSIFSWVSATRNCEKKKKKRTKAVLNAMEVLSNPNRVLKKKSKRLFW